MASHERILGIIEEIYDAALNESLWPATLKSLTDLTGSQASSFWVMDQSESPRLPTFVCLNFSENSVREYLNGMAELDPTVRYLVSHPRQSIVHDGLLEDNPDKNTRDYYDWHERSVETRFRLVGQTHVVGAVQAGVALHRTQRAGPYEAQDIEQFGLLHGHLRRALAMGFRLGSLGAMQQFGFEWLDRSSAAVVLLDEHRRVIFVNRYAQALQATGDGIALSTYEITLARKEDDCRLQSLITQALSPSAPQITSGGGFMRASRPSGKRPYGISVTPISARALSLSRFRPSACIVITDPDRQATRPSEIFQAAFGLTEAEGKLATLLAGGEDLRSAAGKLKITYGTARTRLAQIFQKTSTRRQGELIRLLLTIIPV